MPQTSKGKGNKEGRNVKINPESDSKELERQLLISNRRARFEIMRTVNSNIGKHGKELPKFFTNTIAENYQDIEGSFIMFKAFIKKLNWRVFKTKVMKLKYLVVIEFQKRGAIHFHVIFFNLPFVPVSKDYQDKTDFTYNLADLWGHGFVKINKIDDVDNVGAYVAGYVSDKDKEKNGFLDARYFNHKRYSTSRGLLEPIVEKAFTGSLGTIVSRVLRAHIRMNIQGK